MSLDFYLASRSSRRVRLLRQAGYQFTSRAADIEEQPLADESPGDFSRRMALEKARTAYRCLGSEAFLPVLAADTDVSIDGAILGKPKSRADALAMLARLSGRRHEVHSTVAICLGDRELIAQSRTEVEFGQIQPQDAERYWQSGEPEGKAGAYAIQGLACRWVRRIDGSYTGVVGLPMFETIQLLSEAGIEPRFPAPEATS